MIGQVGCDVLWVGDGLALRCAGIMIHTLMAFGHRASVIEVMLMVLRIH